MFHSTYSFIQQILTICAYVRTLAKHRAGYILFPFHRWRHCSVTVYGLGLSRVRVRVSVRVSLSVSVRVTVRVSVKVSVSITNVYIEHRYLFGLHCTSQRNGMER